jgi:hypothetical protein
MGQQYIYVICERADAKLVKIGFSKAPERRVGQLQTGHPAPLVLYHKEAVNNDLVRALEKVIHRTLAHKRKGGEWFALTPEDAVFEIQHALMKHGDNLNLHTMLRNGTVIL